MKYGVLIEVEPVGTIEIMQPLLSRSGDSYPLPPPTTLIGALAFAYLRSKYIFSDVVYKNGIPYSPAVMVLNKVLYACAGAEPPYAYMRQQVRVSTIIYQKPVRRKILRKIATGELLSQREQEELSDAIRFAFGVASRGVSLIRRLYIFYVLTDQETAKAVYGITRIGMKECLVVVKRVEIFENLESLVVEKRKGVNTIFYTPSDIVAGAENSIKLSMPIIHEHNFGGKLGYEIPILGEFYVLAPYVTEQMVMDLRDNAVVLYIKDLDTHIVLPRSILMGDKHYA